MTMPPSVEMRRKLGHIEQQLAASFPHTPLEKVKEAVVAAAAPLLTEARFAHFVPLLVHRLARETLAGHRHERPEASPESERSASPHAA